MENKKYKVLIIDDDVFLLSVYDVKFKSGGFEVITSTGGSDAIKKIKEGLLPDVITFDMVMPDMDGLQFLKELKKNNLAKEAVLIVLSNQSQNLDVEQAQKIGIDGYIVKATTIPSEVVLEVEKIMQKKKKK